MQRQASVNQKLAFNNSSQNLRKSRYRSFLVLPTFASFSYFLPNILSLIVGIARYVAKKDLLAILNIVTGYPSISHKKIGEKWENEVKLDKARKLLYLLLLKYWLLLQNNNFSREDWTLAFYCIQFEVFFSFSISILLNAIISFPIFCTRICQFH